MPTSLLVRHPAASLLSWLVVPLAVLASAVGLFHPAVYREPAWLVPQAQGQDLVTLAGALLLIPALLLARRGSPRATLVWLGLLGYVAYSYIGAAFAYVFNELFLLYVALFGTSVFSLALALGTVDAAALARHFDARTPVRATAVFLAIVAVMLSVLWLGQLVPFLFTGVVPASLERSGGSLKYVFALDLGVVVPLSALSALWTWTRRPWGFLLAGLVLIKATTMGLALLSMTFFSLAAGEPAELGLFIPWIGLSTFGLAMSAWFFARCRPAAATR